MAREATPDGRTERGSGRDGGSTGRDGGSTDRPRGVPRRRFVGLAGVSVALALAGCLSRDPGRGTTTSALGDEQVTTTAGGGVEILVAQLVISDDANGPRVSYRLRNTGDADATIAIRTVLRVEDGGTYEATAYADVPAGDQVVVGYRIATWAELGEADAETFRRGEASFDTYVNGERRPSA